MYLFQRGVTGKYLKQATLTVTPGPFDSGKGNVYQLIVSRKALRTWHLKPRVEAEK